MMKSPVRAARIERGKYQADLKHEAAIHIVADQHVREMEEEIARLRKKLDQFQPRLEAEAARLVEAEARPRAERAYQDGLKKGYENGRASIEEAVAFIHTLAVDIEQGLDTVWKQCRDQAVELTLMMTCKIVGVIADQYHELARELAARCMTFARDQVRIKVLVNPEDAETLRKAEVELMSLAEGVKEIEIAERASIGRGGVIIETDSGQIDARLEEQLDALIATMKPGWSHPGENHRNQNSKTDPGANQTA